MILNKRKIIAATTSPRRQKLLKKIIKNISFTAPCYHEKLPRYYFCPILLSLYYAFRKACSLKTDRTVLAFDTIVFRWFRIFGKPKDVRDAERMLNSLNGKKHYVMTGMVLREGRKFRFSFSLSRVRFRNLTKEMIRDYIGSDSWQGKAGAYGIQDHGRSLVENYQGDYYNIVGLPIEKLKKIISGLK